MAEGQIDPYAVHARIAMLGETTEWVRTAIHAGNTVKWTMDGYIHAREWADVCVRGWEQYGDMTDATLLEMATRNRWVWTHAVGMLPCEFEHDKQEPLWRDLLRVPYPLDSRQVLGAALKALDWGIAWGRTAEKWETWKEERPAWCTEVEKAFGLFEDLHRGGLYSLLSSIWPSSLTSGIG